MLSGFHIKHLLRLSTFLTYTSINRGLYAFLSHDVCYELIYVDFAQLQIFFNLQLRNELKRVYSTFKAGTTNREKMIVFG